jgi:membrane-bound lytic murein transglycosylase D
VVFRKPESGNESWQFAILMWLAFGCPVTYTSSFSAPSIFPMPDFLRPGLLPLLATLCLLSACATSPSTHPAQDDGPSISAPLSGKIVRPAVAGVGSRPSDPLILGLPVQAIQANSNPPLIDLTIAPDDLWQRIRHGFGMPDLHDPLVADRQSWYLNRPDMLRRIFSRGSRYLYHIVDELEKRGMPTELALLPMVESAFNPRAVSSARAMGIWQFIPSTGKSYNLDQNWWVDERRDIIASTDAALTYLQKIYEMHGDWHLALASYNWGEGSVGRAIAKNQAKGLPTDYASLTMPAETRYYVPKLQALKNIIAQPELFGIHLTPIPNQPYFETVMKPERIDVAVAARLAEIPVEEFVSLNPAYHRPVINSGQAGPLVLPADKVNTFLANLERYEAQDKPLSNWQTYPLKRGDTLAKVAARFKLSEARLRQINGITPRVKTGIGFNLLVPHPGSQAAETISHLLPEAPPEKAAAKKAVATQGTKKVAVSGKAKPVAKASKPAKPQPQKKKQR